MANIKDVAHYAKVSVATVSRYLNQNGYVSNEAKQKIEEAIQTLSYKPSYIARSLSKKQSKLIGLIVPDIQNPYFPQLARAIEDTALQFDYTIILCNTDGGMEKEKLYIERLSQNYVAGILVATNLSDPSFYQSINMPIVALDRLIESDIPCVLSDNFNGAKKATEHLLRGGAKNIICLRGPIGVNTADDREKGFYAALEGQMVKANTIEAGFEFHEAAQVVNEALQQDETIDAVFASSDMMAIAAIKTIQRLNKIIPNDIQVIGFDGIELGKMISPELSTISQDIYQIGKYATEMLISQIEGKPIKEKTIIIPTTLQIRGTTRKERNR